MMLPGGVKAIVDISKLRDYCLDPHPPRGRHKALVFLSRRPRRRRACQRRIPAFLSLLVLRKYESLVLAEDMALMASLALFGVQLVLSAPLVETAVSPASRRAVALAVFHHDAN